MALLDNSLLVYTADNMLYHFLVIPTKETIKLHLCGSISFQGILQVPSRVRALSWMIPQAQKGEFNHWMMVSKEAKLTIQNLVIRPMT